MSDVDSSNRPAGHGPKTHGNADPTRETISHGATPVISNRPPAESSPAVTNHFGDSGADEKSQSSELPRQQIGRYRILKLLGTGGYGAVYLAQDDVLQRKVSIKLPHRRRIRGAAQMQLYMKEAMMVAQLDHPKIVPVYDVGTLPEGTCYVVSKYIDCETLADKIKQPVTPVEAIEIAIDLATTLQHVHEAGIVHRDLKPSNVLVSRDGEYFINDFGLAMIEVNETDRGVLIGTPAYMSPEQASGEGHLVDGRSDVFSLGVMLYEMLVGRRPFRGGSTEQVLYQIRTIDHKPLRQFNRELPVALERVCQKALSKQKGSRYSSAIEFADDLRTVLEDWKDFESEAVALNESTSPTSKSGTQSNSAGDISWQTTSGDESRVVVIPKGLRAYDQHDAAFFKAMLPGPYDLTGCPESIRFWKNRINPPRSLGLTERQRSNIQVREIEPFRIGVIYGTSGCGKSSFIRAGLIPTLDESVRVCIVDATSQGTLARLSQALAKCVPTFDQIPGHAGHKLSGYAADKSEDFSADLDEGAALKRSTERADNQEAKFDNATIPIDRRFASIRRGENLPEGDKVLIVIDQFEQWLNSADAEERALFIRTLRQCDGHRLQAILLVRDDFWLATSRLMRELDIELSASHNLAMIDLIDKSHARKLLGMLGRAYGRIGEDGSRLRREQRQFIHDAVDGLASGDRVIAVQLAMFAEMMKSRPWTRVSLKSLGGIDRVVERFLHESFDAPSAPKNQRVHREAAYKLLGAMLPEIGLIRAGAIELSVLARTAGYDNDPEAMSDLIRVLDNRLKLITQVETGPGDASGDLPASKAARMETRYQLTHDSLIPAIRRWLAQYQNGSIAGRAKRDLRARSQVWAAGRDDRQLASLLQWVRFSLLVPRADRTEVEQEMMSVAGWKHCRSILFAMTLLAVVTLVVRHLRSESRANNLVNQLTIATTNELPRILDEIDSEIGIVMPKLRDRVKQENEDDHVRYVAAMALPRDEELSPDVVTEYLLSAGLDLVALSRRLRPDWIDRFAQNWANALGDTSRPVAERLRAGLFLTGKNPTVTGAGDTQLDSEVEEHVAFLAGAIVDESLSNKFSYADLIELAKPMRKALQAELHSIACDAEQGARQGAAISLIRDLYEGNPIDLVDAALDLPSKDFLEIVRATDLRLIPEREFDRYLNSADIDPRQSGRRAGRAVAVGAVKAISNQSKSTNGEFDWATKMSEVTRVDREDVGAANLVHCLVPLGFDPERLFDSVFDGHAGIRCVQLYALGEFLQSQPTGNEGFRNRCRSIARERFQSDSDPGVFSAARWLLIRLGDQSWIDEELARRVRRVGDVEDKIGAASRLRINSQKTPMIRFPAGTIAATTEQDRSLPDPHWNEPLPYEIEVATDEVSVRLFKEFDPAYSHVAELKSKDELAPVGVVPWEEAVAYCAWLTLQDGMSESDFAYEADAEGNHTLRADFTSRRGYRLPTAREWVAIWDADTTRVACIDDDSLVEYYARILPYSNDTPEPIGGVKADRNGVFHLAGNAHEWCSDHLEDTSLRAARGSFYGWGLKERNQIVKESWVSKYNVWIRYGFRVVRSTARVSTADTHQ